MDLDRLNAEQRAVVLAGPGNLQCVAGAGAGKTLTLIYKIAHEIEKGRNPKHILAMTFTKKAATEMQERLFEMIGDQADDVYLGTIHAWCYALLRHFHEGFELIGPNLRIAEDFTEVLLCLPRFLGRETKDKEVQELTKHFTMCVTYARPIAETIGEDEAIPARTVWAELRDYQHDNNCWTFDDMLYLVYKRMLTDEKFRLVVSRKYSLVIIDEAQDSNYVQNELTKLVASHHKNLLVIGDDWQSIYAFRGAHVEGFVDFASDARVFKLETNYRSVPEIVEFGNALIGHNAKVQLEKKLTAHRPAAYQPELHLFRGEPTSEILWLVRQIQQRVVHARQKPESIAVLFRSVRGDVARGLQLGLAQQKIPYVVFGGGNILNNTHVKSAIAAFSVACGDGERHVGDWRQLLTQIPGIGSTTALKIFAAFPDREVMAETSPEKGRVFVEDMFAMLDGLKRNHSAPSTCVDLFQAWYTDLLDELEKIKAKKIFATLGDLLEGETIMDAVANFQLAKEETEKKKKDTEGRVIISTVHQAKGLEWETVYVPNVTDGGIPWMLAKNTKDIQEECRVFYVAVTRARTELFLSATLESKLSDADILAEESDLGEDEPKAKIVVGKVKTEDKDRKGRLSRFLTPALQKKLNVIEEKSIASHDPRRSHWTHKRRFR